MTTYISLLRGINVSGQKKIKMEALRAAFEKLGFQNVTTYVQSGNVVFAGNETEIKTLEQKISDQIEREFGFTVSVIVLTRNELVNTINRNPFAGDPGKEPSFQHVTFLASEPVAFNRISIEEKRQGQEEILFSDRTIYLYCPHGYGRTKLNNNFLESRLKMPATTRNWKTVNELLRIANEVRNHS